MAPSKSRLPNRPKPKLAGSFVPRSAALPLQVVNNSQRLPPPASQPNVSHENYSQSGLPPSINQLPISQQSMGFNFSQQPRSIQQQSVMMSQSARFGDPSSQQQHQQESSNMIHPTTGESHSSLPTPMLEELEVLRERNFELEAWVQTVEAEKAMAIESGIAAAKAELQFKQAELNEAERTVARLSKDSGDATRRVSRVPGMQTPHATQDTSRRKEDSEIDYDKSRVLDLIFSFEEEEEEENSSNSKNIWLQLAADSVDIRLALRDVARRQPESGQRLLEAVVNYCNHLELAVEIVDALDEDLVHIDPDDASRIAISALLSTGESPQQALPLVLALEQNCSFDGGLNDEAVRTLWNQRYQFFFSNDHNDNMNQKKQNSGLDAFAELSTAFAVRHFLVNTIQQKDKRIEFFHTTVWPRVTEIVTTALKENVRLSRIIVRGLIDAAAAVAIDNPDRCRSLFSAFPQLIPGLTQFANDSLDIVIDQNLTRHSVYFDDACALVHLLGHLTFFGSTPARAFVQEFLQNDILASHELRALCHRMKFAISEQLTSDALRRDANHILATLNESL